jgi:hypothetical protein
MKWSLSLAELEYLTAAVMAVADHPTVPAENRDELAILTGALLLELGSSSLSNPSGWRKGWARIFGLPIRSGVCLTPRQGHLIVGVLGVVKDPRSAPLLSSLMAAVDAATEKKP